MAYGKQKPENNTSSAPYKATQGMSCAYGDWIDKGEKVVHNPENVLDVAHLQCAKDHSVTIGKKK